MSGAIVWDIETGPVPEDELRRLYQEPTWEEFSATCDQRWKDETKRQKFDEKVASAWGDYVAKAALSPLTGRVLAVGMRSASNTILIGDDGETEAEILCETWDRIRAARKAGRDLIGFNIAGFDLPFLERRSWWHQVPVPEGLWYHERYLANDFTDLMQRWQAGSRDAFIRLGTLAAWLGVGEKPDGVTGADFARLWLSDKPYDRQVAREYLDNDLAMTWAVAERMGVIR